MTLSITRSLRSVTRLFSSHLPRHRWPAFVLALATLLVLVTTAAAAIGFILKWGTTGTADGQFLSPRGIAVDSAGNVYVADQNPRVQKFDSSGTFLFKFGGSGSSNPGEFIAPSGVAVDSAGNIYVTDSDPDRTNHLVQKFNSSGTFLTSWGTQGTGNSQFFGAGGVTVDSSINVYVADPQNHRIQKFTSTGTFITKWGSNGAGDGQFSGPQGVAVDALANVYVADTANNRIQKFDSTGTFITKWGSNGSGNGEFNGPQGVSVDSSGNVYVADSGNSRIQKFSSGGTFLEAFGTAGTGDGEFSGPQDLAADATGNIYVADTGNERVQKLGTAAPLVADAGPDQTVECTGASTDVTLDGTGSTGGGTLSYTWKEGATALGTGAMLTVSLPNGPHNITLTVMSSGGGSDDDEVLINIVDTTAPSISCPANITANLPPNSSATSVPVTFSVTASDGCSSSVTITTDHASGSSFSVGTTTVNAMADDHNGNTSACSFTVTVLYNFTGFFSPISNLPVLNVVNAGRAIPVKFSLSGNKGLNIFALGSPSSGPIACNSSDPAVDLEETVTAGNSTLNYDAGADQYIYVWKTEASWAGTCRQLVVQLNDGSIHRANFKFR